MSAFAAVETLCDLELWCITFGRVSTIIDVDSSFDASVGSVGVCGEYNDRFVFSDFLVFLAEWCNIDDWECILFFDMIEGPLICVEGYLEMRFVDSMDNDSILRSRCLESFDPTFPIDVSQHLCLFFRFASHSYGAFFRRFADSKDGRSLVVMNICVDGGLNSFGDVFVRHCA